MTARAVLVDMEPKVIAGVVAQAAASPRWAYNTASHMPWDGMGSLLRGRTLMLCCRTISSTASGAPATTGPMGTWTTSKTSLPCSRSSRAWSGVPVSLSFPEFPRVSLSFLEFPCRSFPIAVSPVAAGQRWGERRISCADERGGRHRVWTRHAIDRGAAAHVPITLHHHTRLASVEMGVGKVMMGR